MELRTGQKWCKSVKLFIIFIAGEETDYYQLCHQARWLFLHTWANDTRAYAISTNCVGYGVISHIAQTWPVATRTAHCMSNGECCKNGWTDQDAVCVSVPSIDCCMPLQQVCCCGPGGQVTSIDCGSRHAARCIVYSSVACHSVCGQCHVVSWRRKLNTDLLILWMLSLKNNINMKTLLSKTDTATLKMWSWGIWKRNRMSQELQAWQILGTESVYDNTVEENSSVFCLIRMRWLLPARACRQ